MLTKWLQHPRCKAGVEWIRQLAARVHARLRRATWRDVRRALAAIPALGILYVLVLIPFTPGISDIRKARIDQPAQILTADGKPLAEYKWANREWVSLHEVSPHVVDALIATEDHRFYQHHGIDWRRTASAMLHTFSGERQGGSTITQQLARNLYPDEVGRERTLTRKIKEAITAIKIEALYSKDEILETYLNTVPFLYNAYGIEMAARTYFGKSASQLDVLESATLVGMLKGNSYYNPVLNPERAQRRRNIVLSQMVRYGKLEAGQLDSLQKRSLRVDFERQTEPPGPAPHFSQQLRKWLIAWADENDYNVYADGLVVYTTIDSRLQNYATRAVSWQSGQLQSIADAEWARRGGWRAGQPLVDAFVRESPEYRAAVSAGKTPQEALKALQDDRVFMRNLRQQKTQLQAGFLAQDPRTGAVLAWVGSRDFEVDAFDHVAQARRQPGSTFKPFVYGAAFAQGESPSDTFIDQDVSISLPGGEIWHPTDEGQPSGKSVSLRDGLVHSKNRITAQLMQKVGPARVARLAYAMGVRESRLDEVPSLALGTSPVSLREMVNAYSTIANDGRYVAPMLVSRIENRKGEVLAEFSAGAPKQALARDADRTLLDVMRGVVDRGTGTAIRARFGIRADVAGKTGTTQDNTDGWFILMHPQMVAGAWVGFNDSRVTLQSDYWGQGAHSALPMVGYYFQRALSARLIDAKARFDTQHELNWFERLLRWLADLWQRIFGTSAPPEPEPETVRRPLPVVKESEPPAENVIDSGASAPVPVTEGSAMSPLASAPVSESSSGASENAPGIAASPPTGHQSAPEGLPAQSQQ